MSEFDDGSEAGMMREDLAVAEGPVVAASGTGAGSPDDGAFENDKDHPGKGKRSVGGKALATAKKSTEALHNYSLRGRLVRNWQGRGLFRWSV